MSIGIVEIVLLLFLIVPVVLAIIALVSIFQSPHLNSTSKAIWVLITLFFPVVGSLVWLIWGQKAGSAQPLPPDQN